MEFWLNYLPIVIYFLLIVLLIVLIIVCFRALSVLTKVDKIVDNINDKIEAINPIFNMIDFATDRIASLSDSVVDLFTGFLGKLINRKKKGRDEDGEE